jgi:bis(5'-nucleosidyl)-tetraphosphatase
MKKELSAGVIVYYEDQINDRVVRLYLLLYYRHGYWDLPKGKLEEAETNLQAAVRELKEETGLEAELLPGFEQSLSYMFKDPTGELVHKTVTYFVGKARTKEVALSFEHISYKWLSVREALQELTYTNSQQMLAMVDHFVENYKN